MTALLALVVVTAVPGAVGDLKRGQEAFRAGDYAAAARVLASVPGKLPRTRDYALYFLAESEFYAGAPARARGRYGELARVRGSRLALVAPWRVADCLWAEGRQRDAVAAYRRLLRAPPPRIDPVVARFRVAALAPAAEGRRLFRQIFVESPAHPLAEEARRRAGDEPAAPQGHAEHAEPSERLRRAALLAEGRHYTEALAELAKLPAELPDDMRAQRDFELGMAKYRMRRDYATAASLLLGVVPLLSGEKAAFAAFHGARALSRVDRDDEAIAGYRRVVERFPGSRWAAEAQFLAGWLEFNRGRFAEALPGLRATLARHGRSAFANDAAWFLAMAHFFLGQPNDALAALAEYARLSGNDGEAAMRALYWRARALAGLGRMDEARGLWRECVRRSPLGYYGLLARARLRAEGAAAMVEWPTREVRLAPPRRDAERDPALARSDELAQAGLVAEAGDELARAEEAVGKRLGRDEALGVLLERYGRLEAFHRAYQLAETRGAGALATAPTGAARRFWEAAYPRAYRPLIDKYGPAAGNPELFLYAIMRKESGFDPDVVSYADARGLLQLIPAVGEQVAAEAGTPFFADELYDVETNIRIGAAHIGGLVKAFGGQLLLAAGAYNGGVKPMQRWLAQHGRRPLDEFVELVTYEQTREYMKRVIGIQARYVYLYTGVVYELPLTVAVP